MDVRLHIPADLLRDPDIVRRVRDFRREERLRHALIVGALALASLAFVARGALLWCAAGIYAIAALGWTVRLERMMGQGMYESFHGLECAVWARMGRLRVRQRDIEVLEAFMARHGLDTRFTLAELYEYARSHRHDGAGADAEFREVADAVYRFLVSHRYAVTDALLIDLAPRAALFVSALALLAGGGAALLASGRGALPERLATLACGLYLFLLARSLDAGRPAAMRQAVAVAAAAGAWAVAAESAALLALPLAFAGLLWFGRRALDRE
ncbi:MAG TPA: hypothetical protein VKA84_18465 [Gemmatimonadaceae bacterium]|nr:hypothetical protein [Gemmatimonadaceae bacterium]